MAKKLYPPDTLAEVDENGKLICGTEAEMRERVTRERREHEAVMACVRELQAAGKPVTDAAVAAMMAARGEHDDLD
jgi:hypothetical protein